MSKQFIRNLRRDDSSGYMQLIEQLYDYQHGKCIVCGKEIDLSKDKTSIIALNSNRKFRLQDYVLSHKECDRDSYREDFFQEYVHSPESVSSVCFNISFEEDTEEAQNSDSNSPDYITLGNGVVITKDNVIKMQMAKDLQFEARSHIFYRNYKKAIQCLEKAIITGFANTTVYMMLIDMYDSCEMIEKKINTIQLAIEKFGYDWFKRKLIIKQQHKIALEKPSYICMQTTDMFATQHIYNLLLPEFNFYYKGQNPFKLHNFDNWNYLPTKYALYHNLLSLQEDYITSLNNGDEEEAIMIMEYLIANNCDSATVYFDLEKEYLRNDRKEDAIRVIRKGIIDIKSNLEKRFNYVRSLAEKYDAINYFNMCMKYNIPIRYFCGGIVLYNPAEIQVVEKMNKELIKITK